MGLDEDNAIYLFDAKYYNLVNELNYKQVVYDYAIKYEQKNVSKRINNYLILPSEEEDIKIYVDRSKEYKVVIYEMYLWMNDVISKSI